MFNLTSICGFFQDFGNAFVNLWGSTGIYSLFTGEATWQNFVMIAISFVLVYLAVVK
jgi:Na+-transporting methylmalonyl-CoA/oxaloacetate decarboxylase beta subunit